ncbi:MAG: DUF333 domain-containing protein [Chloroflexi bacterium]|nr:DUF333 domain-containing protein [Chloroflexota bacterium]
MLIVGCSSAPAPTAAPTSLPAPAGTPTLPAANLPNPASANCGAKGGRLDIRTDASGGQVGICVFPGGSECEEWALYRNECQFAAPALTITSTTGVTVLVPLVSGAATTPELQAKPIIFQPDSASAMVADSVAAGGSVLYSVHGLAGQTLSVDLTTGQGSAVLQILGGDGTVLLPSQVGITSWSGVLPGTQDYTIDVRSVTNIVTDYWLEVTIPPL